MRPPPKARALRTARPGPPSPAGLEQPVGTSNPCNPFPNRRPNLADDPHFRAFAAALARLLLSSTCEAEGLAEQGLGRSSLSAALPGASHREAADQSVQSLRESVAESAAQVDTGAL
jgi:hypothetical protein